MFKIKKELLNEMIEQKYVQVVKHPIFDLYIYNYTNKAQYDCIWNEITLNCRGLILDGNLNVIAKPFSKFFNIEEHKPEEIPNLLFEVSEKLDGSLGILYWWEGKPYIASRGSFSSEQAIHATNILYEKYSNSFDLIDKNYTYLFEIIYPSNRIVCNYGDIDDIYLLTSINNLTNEELKPNIGFKIVKTYPNLNNLTKLKSLEEDNKEGFVVRFSNGFRIKVKFEEYKRLHRILTNVSTKTIWEHLRDNKPIDELLDNVPDEFYNWVKLTIDDLTKEFNKIKNENEAIFWEIIDKKDFALKVNNFKNINKHLLFTRLNSYSQNLNTMIWNLIEPKFQKPFKIDEQ